MIDHNNQNRPFFSPNTTSRQPYNPLPCLHTFGTHITLHSLFRVAKITVDTSQIVLRLQPLVRTPVTGVVLHCRTDDAVCACPRNFYPGPGNREGRGAQLPRGSPAGFAASCPEGPGPSPDSLPSRTPRHPGSDITAASSVHDAASSRTAAESKDSASLMSMLVDFHQSLRDIDGEVTDTLAFGYEVHIVDSA